jgi:putative DNA primase/helicase
MSDLRSMAVALGGDAVAGASILCPGPGHSPRDRSLSVTLSSAARDGFVLHSHAGDDWRACRDHVLARIGLPAFKRGDGRSAPITTSRARPAPAVAIPKTDTGAFALRLWSEAGDPRRTLAERHLNGRGLELTDDICGTVARFHGACPYRTDDKIIRAPAMLTAYRTITDDKLVAIQRTLLTPEGKKFNRTMLGPTGGAAIKIDADENVEQGLFICEGFETGLAARQLGFRPVWALGSAGAIGAFPVLSGIDALTILAETDDQGANLKNSQACARKWIEAGREVSIVEPNIPGDMNNLVTTP